MNILIVNTLYSPNRIGGAEISVQNLAEQFQHQKNDVTVICLSEEEKKYDLNGVKIIALKIKNKYWPYSNKKVNSFEKLIWHLNDSNNSKYNSSLKRIFDEKRPDILFTNNLSGFSTRIWILAKEYNIQIVHTLRDYYLQCPKSTKYKTEKNCKGICTECKWLSKYKKEHSAKVDYVVGISEFILKDHLKNGYFKNVPSQVIYNGFKIDYKKNTKQDSLITLGFLGQIDQIKGIEFLLYQLNLATNNNWTLKIAGNLNSSYKNKIKSICNSGNIEFLGYVEKTTFFNQIDLLVVPSLWNEPFGRVIIESMLYNTPVLASNVGAIPELMKTNPWFLFETEANNFIDKLNEILSNPNKLSEFVFDSEFLEKLSIEKIANNYINIFKSLLDN